MTEQAPVSIKLNYQIQASDYVKANYLHFRPRPLLKWLGLLLLAVFVILSMMVVVNSQKSVIKILALMWTGYPFLWWFVLLPYRSMREYKQYKMLQIPLDMEIEDEFLKAASSDAFTKMKWTDYHKYKVGKELVLLYHSDNAFNIFPRHQFSDADYTKFLAILRNALGKPI